MHLFDFSVFRQITSPGLRKVILAAIVVASSTVIVKSVAFVKEMFVASSFGLSGEMDSFVLAHSLSLFFAGILAGSLRSSLIPWLRSMDECDKQNGNKQVNWAFTLTIIVAAIIATLMYVLSEYIIALAGYALSEQFQVLSISLVKIFSFQLFFVFVNTFFYSILQKRKRFFLASIVPILTPFAILLSIIMLADNYGVYTLVYGAIFGSLIETMILLAIVAKFRSLPHFSLPHLSPELRKLIYQSSALIAGSVLMGATPLVDRSMASALGPGAISSLAYASRVPTLIDSLVAFAVATAVLPFFSDLVSKKDWSLCKQYLTVLSWMTALVTIPITLLLIYLSVDIVQLIFERGAFSASDTVLVGNIQQMLLLAIPPFIVGLVSVRMLSALSMNHVLIVISLINLGINIVLNLILMKYLGVMGIALSTAIMYLISCVLCVYFAFSGLNKKIALTR